MPLSRPVGCLALTLLVAASQLRAQSPTFVAHTTSPTPARGKLAALGKDWAALLADPETTVAAGDLVALRRADRPLPPWPRTAGVVLANGDRVAGTVVGGDARSLRLSPAWRPANDQLPWDVPLTTLAAVWVTPPPADTPADPARYEWAGDRRDAVLLRNGDVTRGTVEGFTTDPAAVRIKPDRDKPMAVIRLRDVAAVAFDPTLARVRRPKGPFARVVLADGSRVSLGNAVADPDALTGTALAGPAVSVRVEEVVALDIHQGKATYLSDLKPKAAKTEPFNGVAWPWAADRSVKGNPLRLGEHTFDKGVGTHPRTTLTYALGGKYRRFEAVVGLDALTGRRGAADVRVVVDGNEAASLRVTAGPPRDVAVEVTGAKELTLVVDYGPGGDVQDDVNWADARLIE